MIFLEGYRLHCDTCGKNHGDWGSFQSYRDNNGFYLRGCSDSSRSNTWGENNLRAQSAVVFTPVYPENSVSQVS